MVDIITTDMRNIVDSIEAYYLLNGEVPPVTLIARETLLSEKDVKEWLLEPSLAAMLDRRGISITSNGLSPEMLACANVLLDFSDRRSKREKLLGLGITTQQYNAYLRNAKFNAYVTSRAEQLLPDTMHEAHTALLKNVERGDTNSLKLYYEITGRHNPAAANQFNPEALLTRIFEIITTRVKDPAVLDAIAQDIGALAIHNAAPPVAGEILSAQLL
jgi:hypothetical protein